MRKQIMALIAALAISIPASPIVAAPKSPNKAQHQDPNHSPTYQQRAAKARLSELLSDGWRRH